MLVRQFGDVDQALDALPHPHERAEGDELRDLSVHDLAGLIHAFELPPRVFLGRLQGQRHALALEVDVQYLDLHVLADRDDLAGVIDVLPRQLGHVDEAVHPAPEVHEDAEVHDRGHRSAAPFALVQALQERLAALAHGLLQERPAGQDHVVAVPVELDDLAFELLADVGVEVADPAELDQGRGEEAAQADVQDQAALDHLDHGAADGGAGAHDLLDPGPGALVLGALLRQDQAPFLVLLLEDEGLDPVADRDHLVRVDVVADRQLLAGNDPFGLVADVEQDLVAVDLHDGALHQVPVVEVLHGLLDGRDQLIGRQVLLDRCPWLFLFDRPLTPFLPAAVSAHAQERAETPGLSLEMGERGPPGPASVRSARLGRQ